MITSLHGQSIVDLQENWRQFFLLFFRYALD